MRLRNEAKVGLIVFVGVIALIFVYWFLGGLWLRGSSYEIYAVFPSAQKLDKGALVRMAGVQIGRVSGTQLVGIRARVDMLIDKNVRIPRDSTALITAGGFIGENYVEIRPGKETRLLRPKERIRTTVTVQPEQLMEQASVLLSDLRQSTKSINDLLGDKQVMANIKDTVKELHDAAAAASELAESGNKILGETQPRIGEMMASLQEATAGAARTSAQIEDMVANDVRPNVRSLFAEAGGVAKNLNDAITQAREMLASVGRPSGQIDQALTKVNQALDRVNAATAQAEQMMSNLNQASAGVRDLTTDKELQASIKETMRNAAAASCEAKELLQNINRRIGKKPGPAPRERDAVPERGTSINGLWDTDTGDYRFDAYYTLFGGDASFYRAGGYNIGESTKLILQGGHLLGMSDALRYGLYASRLGVGYDHRLSPTTLFSVDVFRPNDPEMEIRGVFGIKGPLGMYAGISDVLHKDNRDVLLGIRYQR